MLKQTADLYGDLHRDCKYFFQLIIAISETHDVTNLIVKQFSNALRNYKKDRIKIITYIKKDFVEAYKNLVGYRSK